MNIAQATAAIHHKKISAVELTRQHLDRIEKLNPKLNAFVTVTAEQALRDARALETGPWRGPLHGVPIGLKDLYDTAGVRTTACSKQWANRTPAADAEAVRRLKAAGAVVLGKLNMDEFAYNFTGATSSFGTSRNPWNPAMSPGGSSGGSAVAVAAGMCMAALGSDTGGSIRLPAALCGITGFKPSFGLISTAGVAPLAWSLDHVGPMCRSAEDAALMLAALTGKAVPKVNARALRIGVPRKLFYDGIDAETEKLVGEAAAVLGKPREVVLPELPMSKEIPFFIESYVRLITAEAYAFHLDMLRSHPELYHPGTRKSIENGAGVTTPDYIEARRDMERLRAEIGNWFKDADLLVTPTAPGPAFAIDAAPLVYLRNCAPWNLLGLPSISIPCGLTKSGLPIGLQITGQSDAAVLSATAAYQKSVPTSFPAAL